MSHPSGCRCDGDASRAKELGGCLRLDCPWPKQLKALDFSDQLKHAGLAHFLTGDGTEPSVYVRGPDGNEIPVREVSYRKGRIIINFGERQ